MRRGFTLIELLVVITIIGILLALLLPAVQAARAAAWRIQCTNNLKQIGIALHNYHDALGSLPWGVGPDAMPGSPDAGQFWSALALALPFMEQRPLHNAINFDLTAWASFPENDTVKSTRIGLFLCPADPDRLTNPQGHTNYAANFGTIPITFYPGSNGVFGPVPETRIVRLGGITDGTSNTVAFGEFIKGLGLTNPERRDPNWPSASVFDVPRQVPADLPEPYHEACKSTDPSTAPLRRNFARGALWYSGHPWACFYNHVMPPNSLNCAYTCTPTAIRRGTHWCGALSAGSRHPGVVNVLMADGSVHAIKATVSIAVWRALGTRAGGEVVSGDAY